MRKSAQKKRKVAAASPVRTGGEHRDLAKGALINFLGILARSSKAIFFVLISRLFGSDVFGLYLLAFAIVDLSSKIGGLGLDWAIMRHVVQLRAQNRYYEVRPVVLRVLGVAFVTSVLAAIGLAFAAPFIAETILHKARLTKPIMMIAPVLPAMTMTMILLFAIRAARKMQYEVYVRSAGEPLVTLMGGIVAYFISGRIEGVICAQIVGSTSGLLLALHFFNRVYPTTSKRSGPVPLDWRALFTYSMPMGMMDLLNNLKQRMDILVIGRFLSPTYVGIFGAVVEIGNLIRKVRQSFEPILMPIIAHLHEVAERSRLKRNLSVTMLWISGVSLAVFVPICFAPDIFLHVFGREFVIGSNALIIFAFGQLLFVTLGISEYILSMTGHPYLNLFNSIALVGLNFILLVLLIPKYGLVGAASATFISFTLVSLLHMALAYRFEKIHPFGWFQFKPVAAAVLGFACAYFARELVGRDILLTLVLVVPLFFVVYLATLKTLGLDEETEEILRRLKIRMFGRKKRKE